MRATNVPWLGTRPADPTEPFESDRRLRSVLSRIGRVVRDLVTDDRLDFALREHLMRYAWETATGAGVGPEPK